MKDQVSLKTTMLLVAAHSDCVRYAHMAQPYQTHSITYTPDNGKQWFCPSLMVGSLKLDLKILIVSGVEVWHYDSDCREIMKTQSSI